MAGRPPIAADALDCTGMSVECDRSLPLPCAYSPGGAADGKEPGLPAAEPSEWGDEPGDESAADAVEWAV